MVFEVCIPGVGKFQVSGWIAARLLRRPAALRRLRVTDPAATGFALGVAAHGLGTARAFELDETAGAFSGLGMGLNALATSLLVPVLMRLLLP